MSEYPTFSPSHLCLESKYKILVGEPSAGHLDLCWIFGWTSQTLQRRCGHPPNRITITNDLAFQHGGDVGTIAMQVVEDKGDGGTRVPQVGTGICNCQYQTLGSVRTMTAASCPPQLDRRTGPSSQSNRNMSMWRVVP
ncbi:hypothetical protein Bbelb_359080 [Branchiostoma belcheri]|nr:hypothetical protein Bbelb_359080 [Branchiostoma belcheri]